MYRNGIKRVLDFCLALIALLVLSPLLLVITIWLHFANKGAGTFFTQERPGKDEKIFKLYKFKSMTDERDTDGKLLPDAERLTPVGRFIRKTSLDELPQLWNVLKGDMALIGPRPLLPEYLPYYTERERLRHTVRPGMSGWAQINGRNNVTWNQKLELDAYYVEHLSLGTDFRVIITTIRNILSGSKDVNVVPSAVKGMGKLNEERVDRKLR
ncbi:sugar transferase [Porphyromonas loveana]|uniref:Lipopolysaccharide/colanic/teichoic acid biosynthesis glycosyltransferase n=2 Tax=Porphyromonas loveana TaxID=1884669 RepID=A0A2U1FPK2_9PORP|nr:sugar transferase [Porphyromonas loveana]PVZ14107.1 lipopolysaccharide/colanic/teichoic acid biosynthesis glycosyltransferase [Porphyromonas loveana]